MAALSLQSKIKLNSGYEIPQLGFGVYQILADEAETCVTTALDVGYRHVDSAVAYKNQVPCGAAINKAIAAAGSNGKPLSRSDVFYTSKVRPKEMSYASARAQVDQTLADTGLGYVDLMLLHSPYGGSENRKGAWRALVECVAEGKVRSIGVSNYGVHHLQELERHMAELEAEHGPGGGGVLSVGQWEVHPWLPRRDIVSWCRDRNVAVEAYCPLVRGGRSEDESLRKLAAKHGRTAAQVLLRWSLQMGFVPMPKSRDGGRIRANADLYAEGFVLDEGDMKALERDVYEPCAWDPTTAPLES